MDESKINYRESRGIRLFDFLSHYKFCDDWINESNKTVEDYQIVEIHYFVNSPNHCQRLKRSFEFGIDDSYFETHIREPQYERYGHSSLLEREKVLSECLPERFRNSFVDKFWVDLDKNTLIIEIYFE